MNKKGLIILSFIFCSIASCEKFSDPHPKYTYQIPDPTQDEFIVSSLEAEGLDEGLITQMTDQIIKEEYPRIDGLLILRNNKLVYENYFHGYAEGILHPIYSSAKSITSILVGIAIDKGFIDNVQMPVVSFLPEYKTFQNPDRRKDKITIEHLLNMNSGLACEDWYAHTESGMQQSNDWVKFTLDLPMTDDPGSTGSYCTGGAVVLGRIIENQSGMSLEEFANQYLFKPLNITRYRWHTMPDGKSSGGGLFFLRPRDMAKIGLLMLNNGVSNNEQIISTEWVHQSTQNQQKLPGPFDGYGYLWWKQAFEGGVETYFANGNGGQYIFIVPSAELILVFTSGNQNTSLGLQNFYMIRDYILPALK
jgi:CubicO group peptidase (beta-lactamase class C family)